MLAAAGTTRLRRARTSSTAAAAAAAAGGGASPHPPPRPTRAATSPSSHSPPATATPPPAAACPPPPPRPPPAAAPRASWARPLAGVPVSEHPLPPAPGQRGATMAHSHRLPPAAAASFAAPWSWTHCLAAAAAAAVPWAALAPRPVCRRVPPPLYRGAGRVVPTCLIRVSEASLLMVVGR